MNVLNQVAIRALNHMIQGESWAQARLVTHSGAQVSIDSGIFKLRLGIDEHGLFREGDKGLVADVSITLPSDVPIRFLLDRNSLISAVKLEGSADIAESVAFVLRNLRWDVEADLARIVGDIAARRLSRIAQALALAIQQAIGKVAENVSEYSVEESRMLTAKRKVAEFGNAVNSLRDDVVSLEKRISRL